MHSHLIYHCFQIQLCDDKKSRLLGRIVEFIKAMLNLNAEDNSRGEQICQYDQ